MTKTTWSLRRDRSQRPIPTVVRPGGEEWVEYEDPHDQVLARLYEAGFDPAAFDPAEVTGRSRRCRCEGERRDRRASAA